MEHEIRFCPTAKAGVGSAINDATRIVGATVGVAVIGSVYASVYASKLTSGLGQHLPARLAERAHSSVGAAYGAAGQLRASGHGRLAGLVHHTASSAFFDGFAVACLVAAGVAAAGVSMALWLLPARPGAEPVGAASEDLEFGAPAGDLQAVGAAAAR